MNKIKKLLVYLIAFSVFISSGMSTQTVEAATKEPYIISQKKYADVKNAMASYTLYRNKLRIGFGGLKSNRTYKLYRRQSGKKWSLIKTFSVNSDGWTNLPEDGEYTDTKVKDATLYYYRLYSVQDKKYYKTVGYWTASKQPSKVKKRGRTITWKKSKGSAGYIVYYHKRYSFWGGYYTKNKYYAKAVSKKSSRYTVPRGYTVDGVYSYSKHNNAYYIGHVGTFKSKNRMLNHVKDGWVTFVLKHKNEFK